MDFFTHQKLNRALQYSTVAVSMLQQKFLPESAADQRAISEAGSYKSLTFRAERHRPNSSQPPRVALLLHILLLNETDRYKMSAHCTPKHL